MLLEICAVVAVLKCLQLFWKRNEEEWQIGDDYYVDLKTYMKEQMKWDFLEHVYWSYHFCVKVMKEMYVICLLVKCWSEYLRMPGDAPLELQEELKAVIFLKIGVAQMQMLFTQQRLLKCEEKSLAKLSYMEKRQSRKHAEDRTRHTSNSLKTYDSSIGDKIYLERDLRSSFEVIMEKVPPMQVSSDGALDVGYLGLWSLHCTEVLLRGCRDILVSRLQLIADCLADSGVKLVKSERMKQWKYVEDQKMKKMEFQAAPRKVIAAIVKKQSHQDWWKNDDRVLEKVCMKEVQVWTPLKDHAEWRLCSWKLEASQTPNEVALKSQLLERKDELEVLFQYMKEFCGDDLAAKEVLKDFALNPQPGLVKAFWNTTEGGSSGNTVKQEA